MNHPERIQAIGIYSQPVPWNSGLTVQQIGTAVIGMPQGGAYRLRSQFGALVTQTENLQNTTTPMAAVVFISDTSDAALQGAEQFTTYLSTIKLTFVLLGPNADQNKLTQFSSNFISWKDLSKPQPDNWNSASSPAYGCL